MSMFQEAAVFIESFAAHIPLELYTFVASFIEEVIAPIPSPFVMTSAGSIAAAQGWPMLSLLGISVIGAIGKTIGGILLYVIADRAEDVIVKKYGKFFGVTHREIENIGKHFKGHWRDDFMLFGIRALPIIPSAPVSIICGIIKVGWRTFILATFFGTIIRNLVFLYFGYAGLSSFEGIVNGLESVESIMQLLLAVVLGLVIIWIYWKRHKREEGLK